MQRKIEVRSQAEFDACVAKGNIAIVIGCSVVARGNSSVEAWDNSSVVAREDSCVEAWNNSSVVSWDNSSVVAREDSCVEAWDNSYVIARDSCSVEARGNVFIRLFSARSIKGSASVVVINHDGPPLECGHQIVATPQPTLGNEWCEFNAIDRNAPFRVENLDKKMWDILKDSPTKLRMDYWHGDPCNETNWCNTTHCRAGYAICLAGVEGFKLEEKYGAEMAGRIIYAVSNPDKELPYFFASDAEALADIEKMAKD